MSKGQIIGGIRTRAERDLTISDGALRLIMRLCSAIYVNPKAKLDEPFELPWSKVAIWCGVGDDKSAARRIAELVDAKYLKCDGLRGCPARNFFFLLPSCPEKGATRCPDGGATGCPKRGATSSPEKGAHHISNSFQEEKIKVKREVNGSLRSAETKGRVVAAARQITDAERAEAVEQLRKLQKELS